MEVVAGDDGDGGHGGMGTMDLVAWGRWTWCCGGDGCGSKWMMEVEEQG